MLAKTLHQFVVYHYKLLVRGGVYVKLEPVLLEELLHL